MEGLTYEHSFIYCIVYTKDRPVRLNGSKTPRAGTDTEAWQLILYLYKIVLTKTYVLTLVSIGIQIIKPYYTRKNIHKPSGKTN